VEFVANKAAMEQAFLWILQLSPLCNFNNASESFISLPAMLYNRSNWRRQLHVTHLQRSLQYLSIEKLCGCLSTVQNV
jgi:hypothetical protein